MVEYLSGSRIQGSSTAEATPDKQTLDSSNGTSGWVTTNAGSDFSLDTTNDEVDINDNNSLKTIYYDLGSSISTSKWLLRFKTTWSGSQTGSPLWWFSVSDSTSGGGTTNHDGVNLLYYGGNQWNSSSNDGNRPDQSGNQNILLPSTTADTTTRYCEIKRDGSNYTCSIYPDNTYGTATATKTQSLGSTTGLRYFRIISYNQGSGRTGSLSDVKFYDGVTVATTDEKDSLTNVPANTRYEETDTRKIYRLASSGTQSNTLGSDGDATNNGADLDTTNQKLGTGCLDLEKDNDDYINATNLLTNSAMGSTGTISLWFKPESLGGYIWSVGDSNGTAGRIYLEQQSTSVWTVFCQIGSSSQWKVDSTGVTFSTGTWYHIVITHDGGSSYGAAKLYINGVDRSSNSNNGTTWNKWVGDLSGLDNMAFGRHHHNNLVYTQDSDGLMDDIGVWNRALTSTEVTSLYNSGTGKPCNSIPSGLRAYYDCNSATVTNNTSAFTEWKERGTA